MKGKYIIILVFSFILFYLSIIYSSKILYPYYLLKEILYYPVKAMNSKDIKLTNEFNETIINNLNEEINELKKLNNISLSISEFNIINATIIERNREYWFNSLTINKGRTDGIKEDMAVIDANGLVGRIYKVSNNISFVKLITTNDINNKISAVIKANEENIYGIINGYDSKNNLLNLIITDNISIPKDSIVETTGMGGVFPRGILIGKVFDIIKKEDNITTIVRVIPSSNIKGERYVSILQRKEETPIN